MSNTSDENTRETKLNEILATYLQARERGETPNRGELTEKYPEYADDLADFFADQDRFQQAAGPIKFAAGSVEPTLGVVTPPVLPTGQRVRYFGDYEVIEEIARGGMGVVYRARQMNLKRIVALKMVLAGQLATPEDIQRFYAEAEAAAKLAHPNIVPIFEVGQHENQHYFSMAFVDGDSLAHRVAKGVIDPREAASLMKDVSSAIAYAHVEGVIHRDLKPGNILIDKDGTPRVTDFGLAKRVEGEASGLTVTGQVLGTPSYMPPEQACGDSASITQRSDVYSLGAVLYCLMTGRPPFQAASSVETLLQVMTREPVSPRLLSPAVPRDLETIILKCLEKEPSRRYQSAQELVEELARFLDGRPILARPLSWPARSWRWCRRHPTTAVLTAGIAASLVIGTVVSSYFAVAAEQQARIATQNEQVALTEKGRANEQAEQAARSAERADQQSQIARLNAEKAEQQAKLAKDNADQAAVQAKLAIESSLVAEAERNKARTANEESLDNLSRSLFEQARALRGTTQPGRRWQGLELLKKSNELRMRDRHGVPVADAKLLPTQLELRNEAIADVLTSDAREFKIIPGSAFPPGISANGKFAAVRVGDFNFASLAKGPPKPRGKLVDLLTGMELGRWEHEWMDQGMYHAVNSDGTRLATTGHKLTGKRTLDVLVKLWELPSGQKLFKALEWPKDKDSQPASPASMPQLAFSNDGRYIAAFRADAKPAEVAVWETATFKQQLFIRLPSDGKAQAGNIAFTADSRTLIATSHPTHVSLWNLETGEKTKEITFPLPILSGAVYGAETNTLATICQTGDPSKPLISAQSGQNALATETAACAVVVWDLAADAERVRFPTALPPIAIPGGLVFDPRGRQLAVGDYLGNINVFDCESKALTLRLQGAHPSGINALAWQVDGRHLVSSGGDGLVKVWELSPDPPQTTLKGAGNSPTQFTQSPDGRWLAVQNRFAKATRLVDRATGETRHELAEVGGLLLFSDDSQQLALLGAGLGKQAAIFDVTSGKETFRRDLPGNWTVARYNSTGELLVACTVGAKMLLWNANKNQELLGVPRADAMLSAAIAPDGQTLVLLSAAVALTDIEVWDVVKKQKTQSLKMPVGDLILGAKFSSDGRLLAVNQMQIFPRESQQPPVSVGDGIVVLWNTQAWKVHSTISLPAITSGIEFSPDRQLMASADKLGYVIVYRCDNSQEVFRWKPATDQAYSVEFARDGQSLLAGVQHSVPQVLDLTKLHAELAKLGLAW